MTQTVRHLGETIDLWKLIANYRLMARSTRFPKTRQFYRDMLKRVIADYREQQGGRAEQREAA